MDRLSHSLDEVPGTGSVWAGPLGQDSYFARSADRPHYAASTMKVAILAGLYRDGIALDVKIPVHNEFASAVSGAPRYGLERRHDQDELVWQRLGENAELGWLADRMITRSSNLAANLVLERIGLERVAQAWRWAGALHSCVRRGIGDSEAAKAGLSNLVTAADLARLLVAIATDSGQAGTAMLSTLLAQRRSEDLAAGLPPGTRVAHKNGWVMGIRHAAGVIFPDDAAPFVLAVCLTTPVAVNRSDDQACQIVSRIARAAWADRHGMSKGV